MSTETVRLIRDGEKNGLGNESPGHLSVHTAPELCVFIVVVIANSGDHSV